MKSLATYMRLLFLMISLNLSFYGVFAQTIDTSKVAEDPLIIITQARLDTLKYGFFISRDLKYHSGDNPLWAQKNYDDSQWRNLKINFQIADLDSTPWQGIGWFRKKFKIDSSLYNKAVAFTMEQQAASEIYLNGKLIQRLGTLQTDSTKEEVYNPQRTPFITLFDTASIQVIAIRFANQNAQKFAERYPSIEKPNIFTLRVERPDYALEWKINDLQSSADSIFIAAFFLAFTILYSLLFIFYFRGKENLYFSLFTGSLMLIGVALAFVDNTHSGSEIAYIAESSLSLLMLSVMVSYVFFLYAVFYDEMPRQFWLILALGVVLGAITMSPFWGTRFENYVFYPFVLLLTTEGFRVIILAVKRKKSNSLIIGIGVIILFCFIMLIPIANVFPNLLPDQGDWIVFTGLLSLPITMLIYLARERARTKTDLENQIVQIQKLSENSIQQEKREAELKIENARKEVELQKATELKSAYKNLEVAHENLKATQAQLIQSEKMASLGELTAGIAHEIQNPLNFVNNFSEVSNELIKEIQDERRKTKDIRDESLTDEILNDIEQNLEKINHHGKRAGEIVKGMLQHSRVGSGKKEPTDINALCDEYLRLSYHGFRAKDKSFSAKFETDFDTTISKINVVPQDIGRGILNLITNAFYAANQQRTSNNQQLEPLVIVRTKNLGNKIEIQVEDNGNGIPDSIKEKIFQPFFTTKPTGQGTGLGLSLSYDIVKAHGGELQVKTKELEGTEFVIVLPLK